MGQMTNSDRDANLPESNLTGRAYNLSEFYSYGAFDAYSVYTVYAKRYHLAFWLPTIVLVVLFVIVNL